MTPERPVPTRRWRAIPARRRVASTLAIPLLVLAIGACGSGTDAPDRNVDSGADCPSRPQSDRTSAQQSQDGPTSAPGAQAGQGSTAGAATQPSGQAGVPATGAESALRGEGTGDCAAEPSYETDDDGGTGSGG